MYRWTVIWGLPIIAFGFTLLGASHLHQTSAPVPMLEPPAEPARSVFAKLIAAPGLVEPKGEVIEVGAALPGIVLETLVTSADVGKNVKAGDPLFRVDDRHLRAQLTVDKSELAAAEARHARLTNAPRPEEIPPLQAAVRSAEAAQKRAMDRFERTRSLRSSGAVTSEEAEQARWELEQADGILDRSQAELGLKQAGTWDRDIQMSLAELEIARARVELTEAQLERTIVRSPIDGELLKVDVREGQAVAEHSTEPLIVVGDTSKLHVRAQIDEHDIERFDSDAKAIAFPRGNPRQGIPLRFIRIEPFVVPKRSLTGDNRERIDTRILPIIFEIEDASSTVFVGQQLDVMIESR